MAENMNQYFGRKVKFKNEVHPEFQGELCLIGVSDSALQVIAWDKRGEYNTLAISAKLEDLKFLDYPNI